MRARFRLALLFMTLCLPARADLPSWDDPEWYAAPPNPLNLEMTPDIPRGVQSTIGPAGGTFSTTGANGDVYALTIPAGALFTDTTISIIPVAQAEGLPEGAGPFSGVILQPNGLELAKTGWLEITPVTPIPPEKLALWGFYGTGQDARGEVNWPGAGDRIVIPLDHFSGAGVSTSDRIDLQLDKWRQTALEDRITSQIAQALREYQAEVKANPDADQSETTRRTASLIDRNSRTLKRGYDQILNSPAAGCKDIERMVGAILGLERERQLLGIRDELVSREWLAGLFDRYWTVCLPSELDICLKTGDLQELALFAVKFERQRQLLLVAGESAVDWSQVEAQVRAALERCGRFKLDITASGQWRDPSGVNGTLSFRVEVPMRLTFTAPTGFAHLIEGEAPASAINATFVDSQCWKPDSFRNGKPMLARVHTYEFRQNIHLPGKLELRATAPEIIAQLSCVGDKMSHNIEAPMSPMLWAVAHQKDLNGEVFKLAKFKAGDHPNLWEMEWTDQGSGDGISLAQDTTKLKFIHIAQ
jgi:hypothetical protein